MQVHSVIPLFFTLFTEKQPFTSSGTLKIAKDSLLISADCLLMLTDWQFRSAENPFTSADWALPSAGSLLISADYLLTSAGRPLISEYWPLRPSDCPLISTDWQFRSADCPLTSADWASSSPENESKTKGNITTKKYNLSANSFSLVLCAEKKKLSQVSGLVINNSRFKKQFYPLTASFFLPLLKERARVRY